tara:strand:- start:1040 stop:2962 length:1923 start_codon:yes stop_codon:yes gene_type:complete
MYKISFLELSDITANQVKLPYSTGLIWGYCRLNPTIKENFSLEMEDWMYYRQDEDKIIEQIKDSDIIGVSNFVWNSVQNTSIIRKIKKINPQCIVVFGGQGTPKGDRCQQFCDDNPGIDILVHGEGELTFEDILLRYLIDKDWTKVNGITINPPLGKLITTPPRERLKDIDSMPSPYLDGLFDDLVKVKDHEYAFEGTIESVRGCPYQCTFCEIGDKYFQKIAKQTNEKIFQELDWLSKNKVEFFYNADSNYGLFKEHLDQVKYMTKLKEKTGYPDNIRVDWAKAKADKVVEYAYLLTEAGMMKGITIALQSMNPDVLKAVRRKNVDNGKLQEFFNLYKDKKLISYVELILGLPKETIDTFKDGIFQIMDMEFHDYVGVYPMTALPNTPFFEPSYVKEYGIDIVETTPAFFHHDYPEMLKDEKEFMVVGSDTMNREEYVEASIWRWMFMFAHFLGFTQHISRVLSSTHDISYKEFYTKFYNWMKNHPDTFLGKEMSTTKNTLTKVLKKETLWGRKVEEITGNYFWDYEEATAIKIVTNREEFDKNLRSFITSEFKNVDVTLVDDLILFQSSISTSPFEKYPKKVPFNFNIKEVIYDNKPIKNGGHTYEFNSENWDSDVKKWCTINMWWGRRNRRYETSIT